MRWAGILVRMADGTRFLDAVAAGDRQAAAYLLPAVYAELRALATARLAGKKVGHTLDATALFYEAYLHLVGGGRPQDWNGRGHFFGDGHRGRAPQCRRRCPQGGRPPHGAGGAGSTSTSSSSPRRPTMAVSARNAPRRPADDKSAVIVLAPDGYGLYTAAGGRSRGGFVGDQ